MSGNTRVIRGKVRSVGFRVYKDTDIDVTDTEEPNVFWTTDDKQVFPRHINNPQNWLISAMQQRRCHWLGEGGRHGGWLIKRAEFEERPPRTPTAPNKLKIQLESQDGKLVGFLVLYITTENFTKIWTDRRKAGIGEV